MTKLLNTTFFVFFVLVLNAQNKFTYLEDRTFKDYNEMIGYNFVPKVKEIPNEYDEDLRAGEYSFGITRANLYVDGEGVKGVYNINQSDQQEYGYKLSLMNARDPTSRGHLKIILNKARQVDALIFKKDRDEKEVIFFLGETPERIVEREEAYFTDKFEVELEATDSIWNKTIRPFFSVENRFQDRLEINDSTSITFTETIKITEKKKRIKKDKSDKKEKKKRGKKAQVMEEDKAAMKALGLEEAEDPKNEVKLKIDKSYFIEIKQKLKMENGTVEDKVWNYPIKKVVEREDEEAEPGDPRFELDFTTNKGDHIYLYLTGRRTIMYMQFIGRKFLMRENAAAEK